MYALDDPHRLDLLERSGLMGKTLEPRLAQITAAAVALTGADLCEVNIVVSDRQHHVAWWPAVQLEDGPANESACTLVVASGAPLVLDDVFQHPHCAAAPWAGVRINSYLGVPILYGDAVVGSLCVTTVAPKHWTAGELAAMQGMASLVEACFPDIAPEPVAVD